MRKAITKAAAVLAMGIATLAMGINAQAQEWPFTGGEYWEVTGIDIKDGGWLKYANWLAEEWRKEAEFAKSKGWIKDYMVFNNVHARSNEPDLYLIRVVEDVPSGAEGEKRFQEYMDWQSKTLSTLASESGNRGEFREVMSDVLIQRMNFRN